MKIGIITTTMGVLFTKAESATTVTESPTRVSTGRASTLRAAAWVTQSSAPVRTSPPTMMKSAAMVHGAGLEKVSSRSSEGRMPSSSISTAPEIATTSTG